MFHSVLIPHRDRNTHLGLCLWALDRSACLCGDSRWEAVVVDCGSRELPGGEGPNLQVLLDREAPEEFNKSRAYNLAIDRARGDILTFLDADAIVGKRFLEAALCLEDASLDRCCYRVRYLPMCEDLRIETAEDRGAYVDELFGDYDQYRRGMEAYGNYGTNVPKPNNGQKNPWGNSQFSITREKLGDLRFSEEIGWGIEDINMNMRLQAQFGNGYRGVIFTDPDHAMFHLEHPERAWNNNRFLASKRRLHLLDRKRLMGR